MVASALAVVALSLQLLSLTPPPTTSTTWVILYDDSTSQHSVQFKLLPDFCRDAVLPMMRPGDDVVILRAAHTPGRPGHEPETRVLDARLRRFAGDVVRLDADLRHQPQFKGNNLTDIGRAFDFVRQSVELDQHSRVARRIVLVGLTDGAPDGPQTGVEKEPKSILTGVDYRVVMLGVDPGNATKLRVLATAEGFADDATHLMVVPHSHVTTQIASIQKFVGQGRSVNADVVAKLKGASVAPER